MPHPRADLAITALVLFGVVLRGALLVAATVLRPVGDTSRDPSVF